MWPRVIEVMLGFWLTLSPFVFRHAHGARALWTTDLAFGFAVVALALLSFSNRFQYAHLGIAVVAMGLLLAGYLAPYPAPPASQNHILVGFLLAMFAIIPNEANLPPRSWRNLEDRHDGRQA